MAIIVAVEGEAARGTMFLEELHASERESGGARTVKRRRNTALEGVAERGGSSIEQVLALLLEDLGERLGVVDGRRFLGSADVRDELAGQGSTIGAGAEWCIGVRVRFIAV
jgi:hypothetical protein